MSKVIDNNDPAAFTRLGIERDHFLTEAERKAYDFIRNYAEQNRGQAPSYATFAQECEDIMYIPEVTDSYEYLSKKLKDAAGKKKLYDLLTGERLQENFSKQDTEKLISWLQDSLENIMINTRTSVRIGTNIKTDTDKFLTEYRSRKLGESFKVWKSKFPSLPDYYSGNMYAWYGRSGRGKSVFTLEEAIESAMQGANVLIWALEMSQFEVMARAYSSLSAREGIVNATIDGINYEAGFPNSDLLRGRLTEDFEKGFETFLSILNDTIPGNLIVRAVDDADFVRRDIRQLESDIIQTKADVVVIDPIYYMDMEINTSKTAGGDVAATSKKLRHLAGRTKTVIHVVTQADEVKEERDEDGVRELRAPRRAEMKKSKAILEDSVNIFGIDSLDGRGIIEIGKGRHGGEGEVVEVLYLPNYGIVREIESGEVAVEQFDF